MYANISIHINGSNLYRTRTICDIYQPPHDNNNDNYDDKDYDDDDDVDGDAAAAADDDDNHVENNDKIYKNSLMQFVSGLSYHEDLSKRKCVHSNRRQKKI